ncbi:MAG TPA: HNH endonuclease [Mycobacterium sp.]|nr:HNH endonuclease [Mycobacterium sp.]
MTACARSARGCTVVATQVHHVHAIARGGDPYDVNNCVSVWGYCHNILSSMESRRRRDPRRPPPVHPADTLQRGWAGLPPRSP